MQLELKFSKNTKREVRYYANCRVTCRDWFQLSLKEGLTVFRDQVGAYFFFLEAVVIIKFTFGLAPNRGCQWTGIFI